MNHLPRRSPRWMTDHEVSQLRGPHGEKALKADVYWTGAYLAPAQHLIVLYEDGAIEVADPPNSRAPFLREGRYLLFEQEARKLGLEPVRLALLQKERRCLEHHLPLRLCPCAAETRNVRRRPGIVLGYSRSGY